MPVTIGGSLSFCGRPEIRMTLDSLFDQARACGAEIIVSDRTGQGLPSDVADRYPGLIWLKQRTGSVFALRGAALARATGDLVATTEDHCRVAPDWCANILRAHVEHPRSEERRGGKRGDLGGRRIIKKKQ